MVVSEIAGAVFEGFEQLAKNQTWSVELFLTAFTQRARNSSLFESRGDKGLMFALTKLLWRIPEKKYFSSKWAHGRENIPVDQSFGAHFQTALLDLAIECPDVLLSMKRHQEEGGYSYTDLLRALFVFYYDNKDVDPYF